MIVMNKAQISIRMPYSLLDQLNAYAEKTGLSKTEVVVRAIANYLSSEGDVSLHQRMGKVEKQMRELEILVKRNN
jgi:predicted DNA-binding protein